MNHRNLVLHIRKQRNPQNSKSIVWYEQEMVRANEFRGDRIEQTNHGNCLCMTIWQHQSKRKGTLNFDPSGMQNLTAFGNKNS